MPSAIGPIADVRRRLQNPTILFRESNDVILVVGGSGTLGRVITLDLLAAGQTVRVMTRTPAKAKSLLDAGAEVVTGDCLTVRH